MTIPLRFINLAKDLLVILPELFSCGAVGNEINERSHGSGPASHENSLADYKTANHQGTFIPGNENASFEKSLRATLRPRTD